MNRQEQPNTNETLKRPNSRNSRLSGAVLALVALGIGGAYSVHEAVSSNPTPETQSQAVNNQLIRLFDSLKSNAHSTVSETGANSASAAMTVINIEKGLVAYPIIIETSAVPSKTNNYNKINYYYAFSSKPLDILSEPSSELAKDMHYQPVLLTSLGDTKPNSGYELQIELNTKGNMCAQLGQEQILVGVTSNNPHNLNPSLLNQVMPSNQKF